MELYAHVPEATDRNVASNLDARFSAGRSTSEARPSSEDLQTGE